MAELRVANWNIEWMNRWFAADDDGPARFRTSQEISGVTDIADLAKRVAKVIQDMDADLVNIQEGPSRRSEMNLFVGSYLNEEYEVIGPAGKGQQKLYTLVRKDSQAIRHAWRIEEELEVDFNDVWEVDIDSDLVVDEYSFTRPPLVVGVESVSGRELRLLNLHTKSKYVHNGARMWQDPSRRKAFVELAVKARRRISAEAMRVRDYLNALFARNAEADIVVTGDFNDGPDLDYFERRFLAHSVAGLIAGNPNAPQRMLRHAFVDTMDKALNYTAEFYDFVHEVDRKVLLDHIFVSPSLFWTGTDRTTVGTIEHDIFDAASKSSAPGDREKLASDHRPQTATIRI